MLNVSILISLCISITLLAIKFGFGKFIGIFSSCVFLIGLFWVLFSYFIRQPNILVEIIPLSKKISPLTEMYEMQLTILNDSDKHHYKEILLYFGVGTLMTNDMGAEIIHAYKTNKKVKWPYNSGKSFPLNDFRSEGQTLIYNFPLLVPKDMERTEIKTILYLHTNEYESGILAIFNPIYNYVIETKIEVDLTKVIQTIEPKQKMEK